MLVSKFVGNHHLFGDVTNYKALSRLKIFSTEIENLPFSSISLLRKDCYALTSESKNSKIQNSLYRLDFTKKKIVEVENVKFPTIFENFVLLQNHECELIILPISKSENKLYFFHKTKKTWREQKYKISTPNNSPFNYEINNKDINAFYYHFKIIVFVGKSCFEIELPEFELSKIKLPKFIGNQSNLLDQDEGPKSIGKCQKSLIFKFAQNESKTEMILFDSLLYVFTEKNIWVKREIFVETEKHPFVKENAFSKVEITGFSRKKQVEYKEGLLNGIIRKEVKSFIKRGQVDDAMILKFLEKIINDFPLFQKGKKEKNTQKKDKEKDKEEMKKRKEMELKRRREMEERKRKQRKPKKSWFTKFQDFIFGDESDNDYDEVEKTPQNVNTFKDDDVIRLKQYFPKKIEEQNGDEVFFVFHKKKKKKKVVTEEKQKESKDFEKGDIFNVDFKNREKDFINFILDDETTTKDVDENSKDDKDEIVVVEEVKRVKKKKGWLELLNENKSSLIPNLSEWWSKSKNKNSLSNEEPGRIIYFLAEFLEIFRRAFKSEEKEYNYLSYFNGLINFFVKSTVDPNLDRTVEKVKGNEIVKKLIEDNSQIVKKIEKRIENNKSLVHVVLNLDEPHTIFKTMKDTKEFEKLPLRYKETFIKCSRELVSFLLSSYSEFETITSQRVKYFNVVKKIVWIIKPVFLYSNPVPVAHYLLNFFLFSSLGKYFFESALQIDELEKKIIKIERHLKSLDIQCFQILNTYIVIENLKELRKLEEKMMVEEENEIRVKYSLGVFKKLFLNEYLRKFRIDNDDVEMYAEFFKSKLLLFEKKTFLLNLEDEEIQKKIYCVVDLLIPLLRIMWDTIQVDKFIGVWMDTIQRLLKLAEMNEELKKDKKLDKEERKKIWNDKAEKIYEEFGVLVFKEISKCLKNDEEKEKLFSRTVNWALKKGMKLNGKYINMSKFYFASKNKEEGENRFIKEVRVLINSLFQ